MAKRKKPTILQIVQVMNHVIQDIKDIKNNLQTIGAVFDLYIELKGDTEKLKKHLDEKVKGASNDVRTDDKISTKAVKMHPES